MINNHKASVSEEWTVHAAYRLVLKIPDHKILDYVRIYFYNPTLMGSEQHLGATYRPICRAGCYISYTVHMSTSTLFEKSF